MHGTMNVKCQNMIYIKFRRVNLPVTVTNERSHVVKGLVEDFIINTKKEKFLCKNLFSK
jgi:hypothetical protein